MAVSTTRCIFLSRFFRHRRLKDPCRGLIFLPILLAFTCSVLFFYVVYTSRLHIHPGLTQLHVTPYLEYSKINSPDHSQTSVRVEIQKQVKNQSRITQELTDVRKKVVMEKSSVRIGFQESAAERVELGSTSNSNKDTFHNENLFTQDYNEMNRSLKIYAYPHNKNDAFANVLLPVSYEPGGNYASESYFKKSLFKSHFLTKDPSEADLFYLPFSIASLRHDKRIGVGGIQGFIRNYIRNISHNYPYWNRSGGADHFYVACHSVGRTAMEKAVEVKLNAIQVVCSSSYFLSGYVSHKDAAIPQIWPRKGKPPTRLPSQRKKLAFYAGAMNSRVREFLVKTWKNDNEISVHQSRLRTPYSEALLGSKYCIHAKGFEVNTARIADALYYGCVPVVLADHYDLPYTDILKWNSFSVVVSTMDIPVLKKILQGISQEEYLKLYANVMEVQQHFQWHHLPIDFDAFHMVMYELWLRRSHVRISFGSSSV